jgi:hypothetical protein
MDGEVVSEFGEPWKIEDGLIESRGGYIFDINKEKERIVACVNACAGIPTEKLVGSELRRKADQRAKYKAAVEAASANSLVWRKEPPDKPGYWWLLRRDSEVSMAMVFWSDIKKCFFTRCDEEYSGSIPVDNSWFRDCKWAGPIQPPELPA